MGQSRFPAPRDIDKLLYFLNQKTGSTSLIEDNGTIHGDFVDWLGKTHVTGNGRFCIFGGDQIIYETDSQEEARAFLLGCFWETCEDFFDDFELEE